MKKRLGLMLIGCMLGYPLAGHAAQTCHSETAIPSSTPTSRFTDHGNGTVTDTLTGLMWAQCAEGLSGEGCTLGSTATRYTWLAALDLPDASEHAGYTDWRLPNIKELSSIVEQRCHNPAINLTIFPNVGYDSVWSASPASNTASWFVGFGFTGYSAPAVRTLTQYVRLVRGGQ